MSTLIDFVERDKNHNCKGVGPHGVCVKVEAVAQLPTQFGNFQIVGFWNNKDGKDHIAIVHGDIIDQEDVPTRLHSECLTGDVMGSLRCDCRDQLKAGLEAISKQPRGLLLYLRQEGRGIGLINKIKAYALQERGLDTVEANIALGFRDDERDYAVAAHMLESLRVKSIQLMTNNPNKIGQLTQYKVKVSGRIPHVMTPNPLNKRYLETKAKRSGHMITFEKAEQDEQLVVIAPDAPETDA